MSLASISILKWQIKEIVLVVDAYGNAWLEARGDNTNPTVGSAPGGFLPLARIGRKFPLAEAAEKAASARRHLLGKWAVTVMKYAPQQDGEERATSFYRTFFLPYQKKQFRKSLQRLAGIETREAEQLVKKTGAPAAPSSDAVASEAMPEKATEASEAVSTEEPVSAGAEADVTAPQESPMPEKTTPDEEVPSVISTETEEAPPSDPAVSKPFRLTPSQKEAMEKIMAFMANREVPTFVLKGYAGTGKTTMVKVIVDWLRKAPLEHEVVLLASTGRAARILSQKAGRNAATVHSHLYTFKAVHEKGEDPWDADSPGQLLLVFEPQSSRRDFDRPALYIIDEASMISDEPPAIDSYTRFGSGRLLIDFFEMLKKEPEGSKVIFIGDPIQLPPVARSPFSPALHPGYLEELTGWKVMTAELTDVVRQAENANILDLAFAIRQCVTKQKYPPWEDLLEAYAGNGVMLYSSLYDWLSIYKEAQQSGDLTRSIVITHTNKQALRLNQEYRALVHGPEVQDKILPDELLMVTQNNLRVDLSNGDQVVITKIHGREKNPFLQQGFFRFLNLTVENIHSKESFETLLLVEHVFDSRANVPADMVKRLIIDFDKRARSREIRRNTPAYEDAMRNDPFLNALRAKFGYAVTTHKGQGGEWPEVFLNLSRSLHHPNIEDETRFRWLYTSVTRARKALHIRRIYRPTYRRHWFI